ncbi:probable L-type lectin-domain containing receptor kinase S.5 [Telopea speciosissima]|uniref:probable L-type lectin-domain containing receptor kinase S.5 n=1 Tax=Telopea speciosissima TaxID=54955 RepID=UPI001CC80170|nr:probable L-type lectin-domain containing receptor kinase S.5 [Telopea speciosissima]
MLGSSSISTTALQITPDTLNDAFSLLNKSGRVMLPQSFKLWEVSSSKNSTMESDILASFNSTFLINIYRPPNGSVGEGFAFVIAPDLNIPSSSYGQWLGLTNATLDNNPSNKIVAIELDTVKQDFDPDDNHLGLDINSVVSNATVSLSKFGIEISPEIPTNYTVWVQYDGRAKLMEVYMAAGDSNKPSNPILSEKINLKNYVNQYSYMGFSASTGEKAQLNCVLKWDLSVEGFPEKRNLTWLKILFGVGVPVLASLGVAIFVLVRYWKKRRVVNDPTILGALKSLPGTPREFSFKELKKATNNFDEKMKLGQGGYGVVYKGLLPQENTEIAVKKFSRDNMQGIDDFLCELTIINRLRHKHLVRLVGWCHKKSLLLLVYEYMPNGSLDNHLFGGPEKTLNWDHRYKIIAGVASALHYLHDEYDQRVIHRDLKASNVMLDTHFNARLGDFGLARALDNEKTSYAEIEGIPGTPGYMAPECFHTSKATTESDVYGFGAVVLEVVCGLRPWNKIAGFGSLVDWVWILYREGRILEAVDQRLMDEYDSDRAQRLLLLGLACCHPIAAERPKTPKIVQIISGSIPPPDVPYMKPAFVWPAIGFNIDGLTTDTQDTTPMTCSSYYYGSETSEWTPRCESRENLAGYSDISLV